MQPIRKMLRSIKSGKRKGDVKSMNTGSSSTLGCVYELPGASPTPENKVDCDRASSEGDAPRTVPTSYTDAAKGMYQHLPTLHAFNNVPPTVEDRSQPLRSSAEQDENGRDPQPDSPRQPLTQAYGNGVADTQTSLSRPQAPTALGMSATSGPLGDFYETELRSE
ncbi:hypothetical protein K470DRAFT_75713 [Piedraia hortae CBS 480.64]|uniref:Uncharacterized protein n=1 Tax=Piedraia hortae CBS 480.64 TaxID=1314780 RepID=A0A6A7BZM9_9PEZI|nr:hypothetical protein K470DRAFT_75713 [Piedraia hortae CBS 480.64]